MTTRPNISHRTEELYPVLHQQLGSNSRFHQDAYMQKVDLTCKYIYNNTITKNVRKEKEKKTWWTTTIKTGIFTTTKYSNTYNFWRKWLYLLWWDIGQSLKSKRFSHYLFAMFFIDFIQRFYLEVVNCYGKLASILRTPFWDVIKMNIWNKILK